MDDIIVQDHWKRPFANRSLTFMLEILGTWQVLRSSREKSHRTTWGGMSCMYAGKPLFYGSVPKKGFKHPGQVTVLTNETCFPQIEC